MSPRDFIIFSFLLDRVYKVAFGESLSPLPYAKAKCLSWAIYETTGHQISYKSLAGYVAAILGHRESKVNPNGSTLGILVLFAQQRSLSDIATSEQLAGNWFQYRKNWLEEAIAADRPSLLTPLSDQLTTPSVA